MSNQVGGFVCSYAFNHLRLRLEQVRVIDDEIVPCHSGT